MRDYRTRLFFLLGRAAVGKIHVVDAVTAAEIALLIGLFVVWIVVLRDAWRAWQPARLLLSGRYKEARVAAQKLDRSWMRIFKSVRLSTRHAVGCALHLEGDLEGSLEAFAPLHDERLKGNMQYAICSIEAANLVLLDRDPERANDLLEKAARVHRPAEDFLLAAHVKHSLGDVDEAARLFEKAGATREQRGGLGGGLRLGSVLLVEDDRQQEAIFHTLRGIYLVKIGKTNEAQKDFDIAARSPVTNVYVERARAMRQAKGLGGKEKDDPRSSLAPQVVAKPNDVE